MTELTEAQKTQAGKMGVDPDDYARHLKPRYNVEYEIPPGMTAAQAAMALKMGLTLSQYWQGVKDKQND